MLTKNIFFNSLVIVLVLLCDLIYSQNEIDYSKTVDNSIGVINLPISNGLYHSNTYTIYTTNTYYNKESAINGMVSYNNQSYYNVFLKYDVYQDELIYFQNETNRDGIQLNKENVSDFTLLGKRFQLIDKNKFLKKPEYFEVLGENETIKFLCKHTKSKKAINENNRQYIEFYNYEKLFVLKDNNLDKLNKSWVLKNYPNQKKEIKDFYKSEKNLYEVSKNDFYSKIFNVLK